MKSAIKITWKAGLLPALLAITAMVAAPCAWAQGTAFTYQGQLDDSGYAADGSYDMEFKVYNAAVGGAQIGTTTIPGIAVDGGLFTVDLDFGSGVFNGSDRWLEIGVTTNGGGVFDTLAPRTRFTSAPYAIYAGNVAGGIADADADPSNELNTSVNLVGTSLRVADAGGTKSANLASLINDADANPANELNTSVNLAGTSLQVVDAGGTKSTSLASLIDDADPNPANELNTSVNLAGTILQVTDAGGTKSANLASLIDDDWAYFSGSGLGGEIYHSGDVALGSLTDPDGHGLNVQNYIHGHGAVRGVDQNGSSLYASGLLGVMEPDQAPLGIPISTVNAGVVGVKHNLGGNGIGVMGWNNDDGSINYAGAFVSDGAGTDNIAVYARAENGTTNIAGLFEGSGYIASGRDGLVSIGDRSGSHIALDADDIQRKSGSSYSTLYLNWFGGDVNIAAQGDANIGSDSAIVVNSGNVGVGRSPATYAFEVQGDVGLYDSDVVLFASDGSDSVFINGDDYGRLYLNNSDGDTRMSLGASSYGYQYFYNDSGSTRLYLSGDSYDGGYAAFYDAGGSSGVRIYGDYAGTGDGRVITDELQITGGSDLSEQFDIDGLSHGVEPGMIVCIDSANPGKLTVSSMAYDRTVAGVISGANGVKPGLLMGQTGTVADGEYAVALTGRVYCMVDAGQGAIEPGDLITTSDVPGHGMRVADHGLAQGAIIGKAMTPLAEGQGLVLVLVSLQ